jgi:preprotein translocase subunit SecF
MNIMKFRPLFFIFSGTLIILSILSIIFWGFKPSIDFSGGTVWQISAPNIKNKHDFKKIFEENKLELISATNLGENQYSLKFQNIDQDQKSQLDKSLTSIDKDAKEMSFETLGPSLGKELLQKTIVAIILSAICLLIFIGSRFHDFTFGSGAVLAMFHDAIILIGAFSVLGHFFNAELDSLFVTALLTTLSASVHDTVITFDRIRELRRKNFNFDWVDLANQAVTEVLNRSLNTSMTVIIMLLALVILGGSSTHWFAVALLIGYTCGTYSSTGIAIPIVLFFKSRAKKE